MEPIRVLQIVEMLSENSGVSSVVLSYYRHVDPSRVHMDFMVHCDVDEALKSELEHNGSRVYRMPYLSGRNIFKYVNALESFFSRHEGEYDIVHGHLPNAAPFYMSAAKKHGVNVRILHSHNSRGSDSRIKAVRNYFLNNMGVARSNVYYACSQPAASYLFGSRKAEILHNAIELDRFAYDAATAEELRDRYEVGGRVVIGHVGRFAPQKNHVYLIELAKRLLSYRDDFVFLLVGDGTQKPGIEAQIHEAGLEEHFILTGSVKDPEKMYMMMDAFILPSLYEGLPVVGVEAQAVGLPCLFADTITDEVALTDLVKRLPLDRPELWIEELKKLKRRAAYVGAAKDESSAPGDGALHALGDAETYADEIRAKGFDIRIEAKKLEERYLRLAGKT